MVRPRFTPSLPPTQQRWAVVLVLIMLAHAVPIVEIWVQREIQRHQRLKHLDADYKQLEQLLASGQWQAADHKTADILLMLSRGLAYDALQQLPCEELSRLDHLWVSYSNGRFGLSVQQQIWTQMRQAQPERSPHETAIHFARQVGWPVQDDALSAGIPLDKALSFNADDPVGHLPVINRSVTSVRPPKGLGWMWGIVVSGTWLPSGYTSLDTVTQCDL